MGYHILPHSGFFWLFLLLLASSPQPFLTVLSPATAHRPDLLPVL